MPLKLVPPTPGRNKVWRVRGTYLGIAVDRSTETGDRVKAEKLLRAWRDKIERGEISGKPRLTFAAAAVSYMQAGGERQFLKPILKHFGERTLAEEIDQASIDAAAEAIHPGGSPATRNRQVYTPISAVLRHVGVKLDLKRPKGAQGVQRHVWLRPEQFEKIVSMAETKDPEFVILAIVLCYTGLRLSEVLLRKCADVDLAQRELFCGMTKNGTPRLVYLPERAAIALANHPRGLDRAARLFRWTKSAELYELAHAIYKAAGIDCGGAPFHIFRHTYGAWMTRRGADLVSTGAWRSATAARVYQHFDLNEEARKADLLPGARK